MLLITEESAAAPSATPIIGLVFIVAIVIIIVIAVKLLVQNKLKNSKAERICPKCGKIVGTDKKFCMNCGTEIK